MQKISLKAGVCSLQHTKEMCQHSVNRNITLRFFLFKIVIGSVIIDKATTNIYTLTNKIPITT